MSQRRTVHTFDRTVFPPKSQSALVVSCAQILTITINNKTTQGRGRQSWQPDYWCKDTGSTSIHTRIVCMYGTIMHIAREWFFMSPVNTSSFVTPAKGNRQTTGNGQEATAKASHHHHHRHHNHHHHHPTLEPLTVRCVVVPSSAIYRTQVRCKWWRRLLVRT